MRIRARGRGRAGGARLAFVAVGLGACVFVAAGAARADGVAQVLTSKTIPAATVAVIDPESGTSMGGGTTDVKVAPGDVMCVLGFDAHQVC